MQFTGSKLSPTLTPPNIASKRHKRKSETCIGSVFDGEHVFEVCFSVPVQESAEKHECSAHTHVVSSLADRHHELKKTLQCCGSCRLAVGFLFDFCKTRPTLPQQDKETTGMVLHSHWSIVMGHKLPRSRYSLNTWIAITHASVIFRRVNHTS